MHDLQAQRRTVADLADTNPETLGAGADLRLRFKYVDLSAVSAGTISWDSSSDVTLLNAPSRARRVLRHGDVLFGTVRPSLQSHGYVDWTGSGAIIGSTGFSVIRAKRGVSAPRYLFHCIMSSDITVQANRDAVGSSYPALNDSDVQRLEVFAPRLNEQAKIAEILDTLDTTIHQTEAIIEKLKQVKQGLLHDLLTRGIDANGELRPPRSQAPHLYKDSPLGWIPKGWASTPIRSAVVEVANGASIRADEFRLAGTPVIAKGDVTAAKYIDTGRRTQFVASALSVSKYKGSMINREFVVCSMRDLVPSAPTLGMASLLDTDFDGLLAQGTTALRLDKEHFDSELFVEVTRLPWFRTKMRALAVGSTQVHMRGRDYLGVVMPAPPVEEQHEIVARIEAVDRSIQLHKDTATALHAVKVGLMDDLLTGRVRVTPLLTDAPA
jgi:type I restriction enzyme, S subunit